MECQALRDNGYDVSVICPMGPGDPARQTIDEIEIYKYPAPSEAHGLIGFAREFAYCWAHTARLSLQVWKDRPFHIIQACNPSGHVLGVGEVVEGSRGSVCLRSPRPEPELFLSRFGEPTQLIRRMELGGLRWLERRTFRTADKIISTNESYKSVAVKQAGRLASDVTVVRSGPDSRRMRPVYPEQSVHKTRKFSLVYLGIMGPQDGVDLVLEAMRELVQHRRRDDVQATLLGFGDCYENLRRQCSDMGLDTHVQFTGRADKHMIADHLSIADVGLCPDLKNPLNDVSTMNKTMEYMAYALPSVAFDLVETQVSGADTVLYVPSGDVQSFADAIENLLDDPPPSRHGTSSPRPGVRPPRLATASERVRVGLRRHDRTEPKKIEESPDRTAIDAYDGRGRRYVDLDDASACERFIRERTAP